MILILDPNGLAAALGETARQAPAEAEAKVQAGEPARSSSLLMFHAGGSSPKAVPLALVTRLEVIDVSTVEMCDGRPLVQYRGGLMPLVPASPGVQLKDHGGQPLLVFVDEGRSVGLIVDEILDIVEQPLDILVSSDAPGVLGTAVIAGRATEILDVGHHLTLAFDDWLRRKDRPVEIAAATVLLVDDSAFFRNMLSPVLAAAGYQVTTVASGAEALALVRAGRAFDVVVSDIEMPDMDGFGLAEALRADPAGCAMPLLALSSLVSPAVVERARRVGFSDYVAKFDRPGLIGALSAVVSGWRAAA